MPALPPTHHGVSVESIERSAVAPGIVRRTLPTVGGVSAWAIEMAAGTQWPAIDYHDEMGEHVYVVSGELIEDERRYAAGSWITYGGMSSHRPRTDVGVSIIGFNVRP